MNKIANSTCLRATHRQSGFTLIEIMIAIFILTVGLLGVAGMAATVINGNAFGKEITTAATLAQDKMEELKNTDYGSIVSDDDADPIYTRTWTVAADTPAGGMKTIEVKVEFLWKGATHNVTLNTIVAE